MIFEIKRIFAATELWYKILPKVTATFVRKREDKKRLNVFYCVTGVIISSILC